MIIVRPQDIPPKDLTDADAVLIASNVPETDTGEDEWNAGTTYSAGDRVSVLGDVQRRFESLASGNVGNNPPDSPGSWLDLGATNRWRMFDGGTSTLTRNTPTIDVTFKAVGFVNALAMFGVRGSRIRIVVTADGASEPSFDQSQDFPIGAVESNWWSFFFGNVLGIVDPIADHVVLSIPQLFNPTVRVIIEQTDGVSEATCGQFVLGRRQDVAVGIYGSTIGIRDFSTKEVDTFGNFRVVERRFAKRAEIDVFVPTKDVANLQRALAARRAKPTVYVGTDAACMFCPDEIHEELLIYGFFNDFDIVLNDRNTSSGTIDLEGL